MFKLILERLDFLKTKKILKIYYPPPPPNKVNKILTKNNF